MKDYLTLGQKMPSQGAMEQVLYRLADSLNGAEVTWAIGASLLLVRHGLIDYANDIDLLVKPDEIGKVKTCLDELGACPTNNPSNKELTIERSTITYLTHHFLEYQLDGIDIDIMADFSIGLVSGQIYRLELDQMAIVEQIDVKGHQLYYSALEDWWLAYQLIPGRQKRIEQLTAYFEKEGMMHPELIERVLTRPEFQPVSSKINESYRRLANTEACRRRLMRDE